MFLEGRQVIEGIDMPQVAGVDEAQEHIADKGTMLGLIKEGIFAIENCFFQSPFTDVIVQGRPGNSQEQGQRIPVLEHISDGLAQPGVWFCLFLIELFRKPGFQVLH